MRDLFQKVLVDSEEISGFNVPVLLEDMEVAVYLGGTYGTTDEFANIYRNYSGSTEGPTLESGATGGPNPFFTGPLGLAEFWAEPGFYDVVISDTQIPERVGERLIPWNSVAHLYGQGTLANIPDAEQPGRYYYATNTDELYLDNGVAWIEINQYEYSQDVIANRPAFGVAGHRFYATDYEIEYLDLGDRWIELGGTMKTLYIESNAAAGSTTGQASIGSTYTDLKNTDGNSTEVTVDVPGAYEVVVQGAGDPTTHMDIWARVYRVSDNKTLIQSTWGDVVATTSSYGSGANSTHVWVGVGDDGGGPSRVYRTVQLAAGDVIRVQFKGVNGTITLNRDLTHVKLTRVAVTGGASPT